MNELFIKIIQTTFYWTVLGLIFKYGSKLATSTKIKNKKYPFISKKINGYSCANLDKFNGMIFICLIFTISITTFFFVLGLLGFKDVDGNSEFVHSMIFLVLFFFSFLFFIYARRCKIYFNKEEIVRYRLIQHKQMIRYDEEKKVVVRKNYGTILFTDTTKLLFNEDYSNYDKFIKLLEEKDFNITYVNFLGKKISKK